MHRIRGFDCTLRSMHMASTALRFSGRMSRTGFRARLQKIATPPPVLSLLSHLNSSYNPFAPTRHFAEVSACDKCFHK